MTLVARQEFREANIASKEVKFKLNHIEPESDDDHSEVDSK